MKAICNKHRIKRASGEHKTTQLEIKISSKDRRDFKKFSPYHDELSPWVKRMSQDVLD